TLGVADPDPVSVAGLIGHQVGEMLAIRRGDRRLAAGDERDRFAALEADPHDLGRLTGVIPLVVARRVAKGYVEGVPVGGPPWLEVAGIRSGVRAHDLLVLAIRVHDVQVAPPEVALDD